MCNSRRLSGKCMFVACKLKKKNHATDFDVKFRIVLRHNRKD